LRLCFKLLSTIAIATVLSSQGFAAQSPVFKLLTNGKPVTIYSQPSKVYYLIMPSSMFDIETHGKGTLIIAIRSLIPIASSSTGGFNISITSGNGIQYYSMPESDASKLAISSTQFFVPSKKILKIYLTSSKKIKVYQIFLSKKAAYGAIVHVAFASPPKGTQQIKTTITRQTVESGAQHNNTIIVTSEKIVHYKPFKRWIGVTPVLGGGRMIQDTLNTSSPVLTLSVMANYGIAEWFNIYADINTDMIFSPNYRWVFLNTSPISDIPKSEEISWAGTGVGFRILNKQTIRLWLNSGYGYLWSNYHHYYLTGPSLGTTIYLHIFTKFNPEINVSFMYGTNTGNPVVARGNISNLQTPTLPMLQTTGSASQSTTIVGGGPQFLNVYSILVPVLKHLPAYGDPSIYLGYSGGALTYHSYTRYFNNIVVASKFRW